MGAWTGERAGPGALSGLGLDDLRLGEPGAGRGVPNGGDLAGRDDAESSVCVRAMHGGGSAAIAGTVLRAECGKLLLGAAGAAGALLDVACSPVRMGGA